MANLREVAQDPDFQALPDPEKLKALRELEPDLAGLSFNEQMKALKDLSGGQKRSVSDAVSALGLKETGEKFQKPIPGAGPAIGAAGGLALSGLNPIAGAAGYYAGKQLERGVEGKIGTPSQQVGDLSEAAAQEVLGPAAQKVVSPVLKYAGKGLKQVIGSTTGSGAGAVEEALKGGKPFKDAMRGKVSGEDIVENVRSSLNVLKEQRGEAYREQLTSITKRKAPIDMTPLKEKIFKWLKTYKVDFKGDGGLDFSNSKLPKEAAAKVEEVFNDVLRWDSTPGNNTAVGLDTLKQRIGNYYSESSAARAVITDMENATKKLIVDEVPQYAEMTKGYSEATKLIKDVESGLMLRKSGMTGRITGDMTLRRLTSAMRENNELRKDLLNVLGKESGEDLSGQVGGYAMSDLIPRGLVGKLSAGSMGTLVYLNPKFWPILAASSPRVAGEFLNVYGKALRKAKIAAPATFKTLAIGAVNRGN